jgi:chromosome segregation ATPase
MVDYWRNSARTAPTPSDQAFDWHQAFSHALNWAYAEQRRCHAAETELAAAKERDAFLCAIIEAAKAEREHMARRCHDMTDEINDVLTERERYKCELTAERQRREAVKKRVAELEADVHTCPQCGENCKQCQCTEKRIAELERQLASIRAETIEACARVAEDDRVFRALPPYENIGPRHDIGEYWPHAGFRIAAAIRASRELGQRKE